MICELIGVFVKDWKNLSTNGFGGCSGKTTGEIGKEEEERRVITSGSLGKFKSSSDKDWSSRFHSAANRVRCVLAKGMVGRLKSKKKKEK